MGLVDGIGSKPCFSNLRSLHFVDDTLLFYAAKRESLIAVKAILLGFEQALGSRINFHKSSLFCLNMDNVKMQSLVMLMNYSKSSFPFLYLRLSLSDRKLPKHCWMPLIERVNARLASWKGKLLSIGSRLTLINFVLFALPSYFMSIFKLPKWVINRIDYLRRAFCGKERKP